MPRYFFDLHDGVDIRDETGRDLADIDAARAEALRRAADYLKDPSELGAVVVSVRDEDGRPLMTVRLVCQVEVHVPDEAVP